MAFLKRISDKISLMLAAFVVFFVPLPLSASDPGQLIVHDIYDADFPIIRVLCSLPQSGGYDVSWEGAKGQVIEGVVGGAKPIECRIESPAIASQHYEFIFVLDNRNVLTFRSKIYKDNILKFSVRRIKEGDRIGIVSFGVGQDMDQELPGSGVFERSKTLVAPTVDISQINNALEKYRKVGFTDDLMPSIREALRLAEEERVSPHPARKVIIALLHQLPEKEMVIPTYSELVKQWAVPIFCISPATKGVLWWREGIALRYNDFFKSSGGDIVEITGNDRAEEYEAALSSILDTLDSRERFLTFQAVDLDLRGSDRKARLSLTAGDVQLTADIAYKPTAAAVRKHLQSKVAISDKAMADGIGGMQEKVRIARTARQRGELDGMLKAIDETRVQGDLVRAELTRSSTLRENDDSLSQEPVKRWTAEVASLDYACNAMRNYAAIERDSGGLLLVWKETDGKWPMYEATDARPLLDILAIRTVASVKAFLQDQKSDSGLELASAALHSVPKDEESAVGVISKALGDAYKAKGMSVEAVQAYEQSLTKIQGEKQSAEVCVSLAAVHALSGDVGKASQLLGKGIALDPANKDAPAVCLVLAQKYVGSGDADQAIQMLEKCLAIDPGNSDAAVALCRIGIQKGNYELVVQAADKISGEKKPLAELIFLSAAAKFKLGRYADVEKAARDLLRIDGSPFEAQANDLIGRSLYATGEWNKGMMFMKKAVEKDPSVVEKMGALNPALTEGHPLASKTNAK